MTILIIARHGNTFEDGETPRRVGRRTDLPLTEKGRAQACAIGSYLAANKLLPAAAFCGTLQRTRDTAIGALIEAGCLLDVQAETLLDEIDYGPDENKTEDEVIARIGAAALKDWDEKAAVPPSWVVGPAALIDGWRAFGARIVRDYPKKTILAVTSNGIARFAPHLAGNFDGFRKNHELKIATGALCRLDYDGAAWTVAGWNIRP